MKTKRKLITAGLAMLVSLGSLGRVIAYMSDAEVSVNKFTVGDVSIEGLEPNWPGNDCPEVKDITSNDEIAKDPQISNTGVNDVVAFITVDSPIEKITVVGDDGKTVSAKQPAELFWFKMNADGKSAHENHFSDAWEELTEREMYVKISANGESKVEAADLASAFDGLADGERIVKRYVFGHKTEIQGSSVNDGDAQTDANKKTVPVFEKVQLKNVRGNEIDNVETNITVKYMAIQSSEVLENSNDLGASLTKANLVKIYDIFVNQNSAENDGSGLKLNEMR